MPFNFDFSDADESQFEPIPEGPYNVTVEDVEVRHSKDTSKHPGAGYLSVEFVVSEGQYENRHLWYISFYHEGCTECDMTDPKKVAAAQKFMGSFKRDLRAFGYSDEELASNFEFDETDLIGRKVEALVAIEDVRDQPGLKRNTVKRVKALSGDAAMLP